MEQAPRGRAKQTTRRNTRGDDEAKRTIRRKGEADGDEGQRTQKNKPNWSKKSPQYHYTCNCISLSNVAFYDCTTPALKLSLEHCLDQLHLVDRTESLQCT